MSLINEALKKAQRQRVDAATPASLPETPSGDGSPAPLIAKRRPPMPARTLVLLIVGGGLVLVTGGILTFVLLTFDSKPPAVVAHTTPAVHPDTPRPTPAPAAATLPPAPAPAVIVTPVPLPVKPVEVAVSPAPAPAPVATVAPPPPTPVVVAPRPMVSAKPAANPAVYTFLDGLRITGVRVSGGDSKVIMNDRIVRLNDYVDRATGLRLTKITATSLDFTDGTGFTYTKDL